MQNDKLRVRFSKSQVNSAWNYCVLLVLGNVRIRFSVAPGCIAAMRLSERLPDSGERSLFEAWNKSSN